eukprot:2703101-Karenia_brevis.AAC.1
MSWPLAFLHSLYTHATTLSGYEDAKAVFMSRLRSCHTDHEFCAHVDRCSTYHQSFSPSMKISSQRQPCLWCVLPYHPVWCKGVARWIRHTADVNNAGGRQLASACGFQLMVRPAWKLVGT